MELSYNELRDKEVISVREGKSLGRVSDLVFCYPEGVITGIVVPGRKCWNPFKPAADIFIDWYRIKKIGRDVVIVDMRGGDRDDGRIITVRPTAAVSRLRRPARPVRSRAATAAGIFTWTTTNRPGKQTVRDVNGRSEKQSAESFGNRGLFC